MPYYLTPSSAVPLLPLRRTLRVHLNVFAGTTGIGLMALPNSNGPAELAQSVASSSAAPVAKFVVGFPLVYHFMGACRHAVWDLTAKGFTNVAMLQSSYALVAASTVVSLGLTMVSLSPAKDDDKK